VAAVPEQATDEDKVEAEEAAPESEATDTDQPAEEAVEETVDLTKLSPEELQAMFNALKAENEALKARPVRKPRERKMTDKQKAVIVEFEKASPEDTIEDIFPRAGATASSHGLLWRMVADGYLDVTVVAHPEPEGDGDGDKADTTDESKVDESEAKAS
jgi:hypothetical protein